MNGKITRCAQTVLLMCLTIHTAQAMVKPYVAFRSQSENIAREMVGVANDIHRVVREKEAVQERLTISAAQKLQQEQKPRTIFDEIKRAYNKGKDFFGHRSAQNPVVAGEVNHVKADGAVKYVEHGKHYGCFSMQPEYTRSFDEQEIAKNLFSCAYLTNGTTLTISGSADHDRGPKDLLAAYFYLAPDYAGSICVAPRIQNVAADLNLYWGMAAWAQGLYFRIHAPITWTRWDLTAQFQTVNPGTLVEGQYTYLDSAEKFFCNQGTLELTGTTVHPLTSARFCGFSCNDNKDIVRLADVQADFGWDFLRRNNGYLGFFARAVAPTGNRPNGRWLFEPVVGNGHHWELGGGLTGGVTFWNDRDDDHHASLLIEANVTHLFDALQYRVFDLKHIPLSRYMPAYRSDGAEIAPVANLTATAINSSFAVQVDAVAMFNWTFGGWTWDLGYNFWTTTCEELKCSGVLSKCYGEGIIKNASATGIVDAGEWLFDFDSTIHEEHAPVTRRVITDADIDYDGARTQGMSHKVFSHLGYRWLDRGDVIPFLGLGGEAEFGHNNDTCSSCSYVSLSQWGVWLKGGVAF